MTDVDDSHSDDGDDDNNLVIVVVMGTGSCNVSEACAAGTDPATAFARAQVRAASSQ
jgi:hypothetical protein